jgi:trehalose 6-phosphate phosphatase
MIQCAPTPGRAKSLRKDINFTASTSVRALLSQEPPGTLPIFVGDDLTDEHAFAVLPHGLTVRVGKNLRTRARFLLRDPEEVKVFLQKLEVEIV